MQAPGAPTATGSTAAPALLGRLPEDLVAAWSLAHAGLTGQALERLALLEAARGVPAARSAEGAVAAAVALDCRLARGEVEAATAAADLLEEFLDSPPDDVTEPDPVARAVAHHALGELAAALGELASAARHLATAGALLTAVSGSAAGPDTGLVPWRAGAALVALRRGQQGEATTLARAHLEQVRASGSPYARATALRTVATVEVGVDRVDLLRRARACLDGVPTGRLGAQLDTDLAGLLVLQPGGAGEQEAVALLRGVEEYAGRQELWPLQGRARRLLERLGLGPRRVETEAVAVLSDAERRVARLAASGLTNRQVAAELVVTVKAVEWHLSRVYRKLGLTSRGQLAATLGDG